MRGKGIGLVASGMIAGIFIGSHMVGAIGASAPCGTATPAVLKPPAHTVLATYDGDTVHTKPDEIGSYYSAKHFTYRGSITITFTGTQIDPKKNASGNAVVIANVTHALTLTDQVAIAPGDPRTQTVTTTATATDNQCKFGCAVGISEPQNLKWHIVVTK